MILEMLQAAGNLQITDLAENFQVSKMTIHRDLVLLEEKGVLKRIHGGAVQAAGSIKASGDITSFPESRQGECLICTRPPTQHLLYTLTGKNGEQRQACCPHCGISAHLLYGENINGIHR